MNDQTNQAPADQQPPADQGEQQKAPAAPEQTSDVKDAPDATKAQFEAGASASGGDPNADPLQPMIDAMKALSDAVSDLGDQSENLNERLAAVERELDALKTSEGFESIVKGAVQAALAHAGSEIGTLVEDVRKMKAKLHHM